MVPPQSLRLCLRSPPERSPRDRSPAGQGHHGAPRDGHSRRRSFV